MLNRTLSAITAVVIGTSGLSADAMDKSVSVSINPDEGNKKSVVVVPTNTQQIVAPVAQQPQGGTVYQVEQPYQAEVVAPRVVQATPQQVMHPAPSTQGFSDTIIYASGVKNHYEVGEPIKIKLKLKRRAYIYFWTVGSSGKSYRILPNSLESYNDYRANVNYVVPERSAKYDFVSDRAGIEQIYVLATNKKINTQKLRSIFSQKSVAQKSMREFITKDIGVVAREQNLKYDIASFQIQVKDKNSASNVNIYINQ